MGNRLVKRKGLPVLNKILSKYNKGIVSYKYDYENYGNQYVKMI